MRANEIKRKSRRIEKVEFCYGESIKPLSKGRKDSRNVQLQLKSGSQLRSQEQQATNSPTIVTQNSGTKPAGGLSKQYRQAITTKNSFSSHKVPPMVVISNTSGVGLQENLE